jgi:hypothetical protein
VDEECGYNQKNGCSKPQAARSATLTPHTPSEGVRRVAGIHLSGPNAHKTAVVILTLQEVPPGFERFQMPTVVKVYEKIGSWGNLFSDERLVDILQKEARGQSVSPIFVDSPLSAPPCVSCQRPVCPGAMQCEDMSVAWMLALAGRQDRRGARAGRKARPINPQSQRLWDILQAPIGSSPTWTSGQAPLVVRARTLQKRLAAAVPKTQLLETSVPHVLAQLEPWLALELTPKQANGFKLADAYRSFEDGCEWRWEIIDRLQALEVLGKVSEEQKDLLSHSVEVFHAFICAWMAALQAQGLTAAPPSHWLEGEGWVHMPALGEQPPP